jgi:3-dehydroquinate dehydratase
MSDSLDVSKTRSIASTIEYLADFVEINDKIRKMDIDKFIWGLDLLFDEIMKSPNSKSILKEHSPIETGQLEMMKEYVEALRDYKTKVVSIGVKYSERNDKG